MYLKKEETLENQAHLRSPGALADHQRAHLFAFSGASQKSNGEHEEMLIFVTLIHIMFTFLLHDFEFPSHIFCASHFHFTCVYMLILMYFTSLSHVTLFSHSAPCSQYFHMFRILIRLYRKSFHIPLDVHILQRFLYFSRGQKMHKELAVVPHFFHMISLFCSFAAPPTLPPTT